MRELEEHVSTAQELPAYFTPPEEPVYLGPGVTVYEIPTFFRLNGPRLDYDEVTDTHPHTPLEFAGYPAPSYPAILTSNVHPPGSKCLLDYTEELPLSRKGHPNHFIPMNLSIAFLFSAVITPVVRHEHHLLRLGLSPYKLKPCKNFLKLVGGNVFKIFAQTGRKHRGRGSHYSLLSIMVT